MSRAPGSPVISVLAVDAANGVGSAAVHRGARLLAAGAVAMRGSDRHADPFTPLVADVLGRAGIAAGELQTVVCGSGPGAFTSLRIAAAIAKGIAHAARCPLAAAPSLAWAAAARAPEAGAWVVLLDALRDESYAAVVHVGAQADAGTPGSPRVVVGYEYLGVVPNASVRALGGTYNAGALDISSPDASLPPVAAGAVAVTPEIVDLARWEPDYGRRAEAQVRWEATHGPLDAAAVRDS